MTTELRESATFNLKCIKGTSFQRSLTYKNSGGSAIDLSGYTVNMAIKSYGSNNITVLALTNGSGVTLTGASGLIEILITDAQTSALEEKEYFYTLRIESAGGIVSELMRGTFEVLDKV